MYVHRNHAKSVRVRSEFEPEAARSASFKLCTSKRGRIAKLNCGVLLNDKHDISVFNFQTYVFATEIAEFADLALNFYLVF